MRNMLKQNASGNIWRSHGVDFYVVSFVITNHVDGGPSMTILVTGGAGYIGSHTCIALLEEGYDIAVLDTFATSRPEVIRRIQRITGKKFPVFTADLLNLQEVKHVFENIFADAVIHFAGLKKVNESILNPLK